MRRAVIFKVAILTFSVAVPYLSYAQKYDDVSDVRDMGARLGVELDRKVVKGLHVNLFEEARFYDRFSTLSRNTLGVGADWKVHSFLKLGAGYQFMQVAPDADETDWEIRHRFYGDVILSRKAGYFKFSLRERFQTTIRTAEINEFQQPRTAYVLRSRAKVAWSPKYALYEPYMCCELNHRLNAVEYDSLLDNEKSGWESNSVDYSDCYLCRVRMILGCGYEFNRRNAIDAYMMYDFGRDRKIDTNRYGVLPLSKGLTGLSLEKSGVFTVGLVYKFGW